MYFRDHERSSPTDGNFCHRESSLISLPRTALTNMLTGRFDRTPPSCCSYCREYSFISQKWQRSANLSRMPSTRYGCKLGLSNWKGRTSSGLRELREYASSIG